MHYHLDYQPESPALAKTRLIGLGFLVVFLTLLAKIWIPYSLAALHAGALTFLPPEWAVHYQAAMLPKTAAARTQNRIIINTPELRIDAPLIEGIGPDELLKGVGHDPVSAKPGAQGRVVLSGHRFWPDSSPWATVFFALDKLKPNDIITIIYGNATYRYKVSESWNVPKDEAKPLLQPSTQSILTLYTCGPTPYSAKNRLGFHAILDESGQQQQANDVLQTLQDGIL